MEKKKGVLIIAIVAVLIIILAILVIIPNLFDGKSSTRNFKPSKNIDIEKLALMREELKNSRLMAAAFQKLSETERGQAILDKIKEYQSQSNIQEQAIETYLQQNNIPTELNAELDEIDKNAASWDGNYNSLYIQNDETKEKMNGFFSLGVSGKSNTELTAQVITGNIQNRIQNLNIQTTKEISDFPKLASILAQIKASKGASSVDDTSSEYTIIIDWRNKDGMNFMTSVKNQGNCGSCWAFASSAVAEAQAKINANNPNLNVDLSEQDLVSCYLPNTYSADGCNGATTSQIKNLLSNYLQSTGEASENCLVYQASGSISCSAKCSDWQNNAVKTLGYTNIPLNNIEAIKNYLETKGPIVTAMNVYRDLYSYSSGIYQHTTNQLEGGHAVAIVGYGEYNGKTFWIVKNSWGADWGEQGYFRIYAGDSDIESFMLLGAK
jgi:C1A family cysteine protease